MRPKKCQICKTPFTPKYNSLEVWCSYPCMTEVAKKRKAAIHRKEKQTFEITNRTNGQWRAALQKEINKLIRKIDNGWPCISSGSTNCQIHAGHYYPRSTHPNLAFHLFNIWAQSSHDNRWEEGNIAGYVMGLKGLYGEGAKEVDDLYLIGSKKWSSKELEEAIGRVKECIKEVPDRKLTAAEKWRYRMDFNKKIGLYD